jgi:hypothetical protein
MAQNSLLAAVPKINTVTSQSVAHPPYNPELPTTNTRILGSPSQKRMLKWKSAGIWPSSEEPSAPRVFTPGPSPHTHKNQTKQKSLLPNSVRLPLTPVTEIGSPPGNVLEEEG